MVDRKSYKKGIDWDTFLGDRRLAEHAEATIAEEPTPEIDVSPPTRRLLLSQTKWEQKNFRLTNKSERAITQLERIAEDRFDETIEKSFVRDAIVRIAAKHPDEVMGMLAAYGFDFTEQ